MHCKQDLEMCGKPVCHCGLVVHNLDMAYLNIIHEHDIVIIVRLAMHLTKEFDGQLGI